MNTPEYRYRGARALVMLHEKHIRAFHQTWKEAKELGIILPATDDPDYISMQTLLVHVLRSSGGYMRWMCQKLALEDPQIHAVPDEMAVENEAENYITHLLDRWALPLSPVEEKRFFSETYRSHLGPDYSIEAMLEHAVVHPLRHQFQLEELMRRSARK